MYYLFSKTSFSSSMQKKMKHNHSTGFTNTYQHSHKEGKPVDIWCEPHIEAQTGEYTTHGFEDNQVNTGVTDKIWWPLWQAR